MIDGLLSQSGNDVEVALSLPDGLILIFSAVVSWAFGKIVIYWWRAKIKRDRERKEK